MIRNFFQSIFLFLKNFDLKDKKVGLWLALVSGSFLAVTLCVYGGMLYQYSTTEPILRAYDDDSSYGVETALKTQLYNHNGSRTYGPMYYRLSVPLRYFSATTFLNQDLSVEDLRHKNTHFHLLFLNLLFAIGTCILILRVLTRHWGWILLGSLPLLSLFFQNPYRSLLLFMAKPDWMLSFMVCLSGYLLFEMSSESWNESSVQKVALSWAAASLTKLLTIFFIPSFCIYFYFMNSKKWKQNLLYFFKFFILFYFLIGFPQSLDLPGYVKYLIQQNKHTSLVDWNFFIQKWVPLFFDDLWRPFLFVTLFSFIVPTQVRQSVNFKRVLLYLSFVFVAIFCLVIKKISVPFEWYTFSFINLFLVSWGYFLCWLRQKYFHPFFFFETSYGAIFSIVGFFFIVPRWVPMVPAQLEKSYHQGFVCREQYQKVSHIIDQAVQSGRYVFVEEHAPFHTSAPRGQVQSPKDHQLQDFLDTNFTLLVLRSSRNSYFIDSMFHREAKEVTDPAGRRWKLLSSDSCGFDIWDRSEDSLHK